MILPRKWRLRPASKLLSAIVVGICTWSSTCPVARDARAQDAAATTANSSAPLGPNDVSWLFPAPRLASDLSNLISVSELVAPSAKDPSQTEPVWPDEAFKQFVANANKASITTADGNSHSVALSGDLTDKSVWRIAALRIDPGAPELTTDIIAQYGQQPQIRLILQPVTKDNLGRIKVHDIAAHVIYTFFTGLGDAAEPGCIPTLKPDLEAFKKIARDFASLRDRLIAGEFGGVRIDTSGDLLGVHPGLANPKSAKGLRDALVKVLETHLGGGNHGMLTAMAVMGIPGNAPEPWMFMAMAPDHKPVSAGMPLGSFGPVPGAMLSGLQFAQGLSVLPSTQVAPTPAPNNLNPISCRNNLTQGPAALPPSERKGLATAGLFALGDNALKDASKIAQVKQSVDLIADPTRSHFFNTDCVSCHTDTRRTLDLLGEVNIPGVAKNVLPQEKWNVRNFGWFPSFLHPQTPVAATATRRTAAETKAVVDFINKNGLAKTAPQ